MLKKKRNPMKGWSWETTQDGGCLIDPNGVKQFSYRTSLHRSVGGIVFRMATGFRFGENYGAFYGTVEEAMQYAETVCCR